MHGLNKWKRPTTTNLHPKLERRFLYNTTIGEEYVNCTTTASIKPSRVKKVYEFGQHIIPQCGVVVYGDSGDAHILLFTMDFCWVDDVDTDPQMLDVVLREKYFPHCEEFTDTVS